MKNIIAGILFIIIGGTFAIGSLNYSYGTLSSMGPGYYPGIISILLIIVGVVSIISEVLWKR